MQTGIGLHFIGIIYIVASLFLRTHGRMCKHLISEHE